MSAPIERRLGEALTHLEAGRLAEAEKAVRRALQVAPRHAGALQVAGVVLSARGRIDEAIGCFRAAVDADPDDPQAVFNLAKALAGAGRYADALFHYDRLARLVPGEAEAEFARAQCLENLGRTSEAIAAYGRGLALDPGNASAWSNHGVLLRAAGRLEDAVASYERGLAVAPARADLWSNLGNALGAFGRVADALAAYERAIDLQPESHHAWRDRGALLCRLGRLDDAIASFDRALALAPGDAAVWAGRGTALMESKRQAEAIADYDRALQIDPGLDYASGWRLHARLMLCDWRDLADEERVLEEQLRSGRHVTTPFHAAAVPLARALHRRCAEQLIERWYPAVDEGYRFPPAPAGSRIRVGFFSPDFRDHPVGLQVLAMLECMDRSAWAPIGLDVGPARSDPVAARIRQGFESIVPLHGLPATRAVALARAAAPDIVLDLVGHMEGLRFDLLSRRIAPVQASLYCPTTSGAPYIDYLVADAVAIPDSCRDGYSESLVRVPCSYFVADNRDATRGGRVPSRQDEGLPEAGFVFASFCETYKIRPEIWRVWMRILGATPGSVLWLAVRNNEAARENLRREAAAAGVAPERLVFARFAPGRADHLARLSLADLCLDTPVYNGHTTTADALWAGVPVLSVPGEVLSARIAASLLHAAGLPDLVVEDLVRYEVLALELATSPARAAEVRRRLADARGSGTLFDPVACVRNLERAFSAMVNRFRRGASPADLDLSR